MSAVITLTDMERAQCRKNVFLSKRSDYRFVLEAMGESKAWHTAMVLGDPVERARKMDEAVFDYCEVLGLFAEAEQHMLEGKQIHGERWLEV